MAQIISTDILHATLSVNGTEVTRQCLTGVTNLNELLRVIRHHAGTATGIASLSLRNSTQGWSKNASLYLR